MNFDDIIRYPKRPLELTREKIENFRDRYSKNIPEAPLFSNNLSSKKAYYMLHHQTRDMQRSCVQIEEAIREMRSPIDPLENLRIYGFSSVA